MRVCFHSIRPPRLQAPSTPSARAWCRLPRVVSTSGMHGVDIQAWCRHPGVVSPSAKKINGGGPPKSTSASTSIASSNSTLTSTASSHLEKNRRIRLRRTQKRLRRKNCSVRSEKIAESAFGGHKNAFGEKTAPSAPKNRDAVRLRKKIRAK